MPGLTTGEIAGMRQTAEDYFPDTAYRLGATNVSDGQGGSTETWGTASSFPCRISPLSQDERAQQDRVAAIRQRIVTVAAETTLTQRDQLQINSTTYEVDGVDSPRSYELTRRVHVTEVD